MSGAQHNASSGKDPCERSVGSEGTFKGVTGEDRSNNPRGQRTPDDLFGRGRVCEVNGTWRVASRAPVVHVTERRETATETAPHTDAARSLRQHRPQFIRHSEECLERLLDLDLRLLERIRIGTKLVRHRVQPRNAMAESPEHLGRRDRGTLRREASDSLHDASEFVVSHERHAGTGNAEAQVSTKACLLGRTEPSTNSCSMSPRIGSRG
jgi:hypothetical protein